VCRLVLSRTVRTEKRDKTGTVRERSPAESPLSASPHSLAPAHQKPDWSFRSSSAPQAQLIVAARWIVAPPASQPQSGCTLPFAFDCESAMAGKKGTVKRPLA
jgi:hypothetical protein